MDRCCWHYMAIDNPRLNPEELAEHLEIGWEPFAVTETEESETLHLRLHD